MESQKRRIIQEMISVAKRISAPAEMIADLERAQQETQFTKAVEQIKHGIPQSLLISNHNPLTLLHGPLSIGLHEKSDEECLSMATSIRLVLVELAEHMPVALREQAELDAAVNDLLAINTARGRPETAS